MPILNFSRIQLSQRSLFTIVTIQILIILALAFPYLSHPFQPVPSPTPFQTQPIPTKTSSPSPRPSRTPTETQPTATPWIVPQGSSNQLSDGWMVFSIPDGGYTHLFLYQPYRLPLTRITNSPWDDITPAISPQGDRIAYSSRQNGYWDLFLLHLQTGEMIRLTDTAEYEAAPSWSPDGKWIVYEKYQNNNLDLFTLQVENPAEPPLQLTNHSSGDFSPSWSPTGNQIAFISDRSGENEVWLADLEEREKPPINLSQDPNHTQLSPIWSPDGLSLAWVTHSSGFKQIVVWNTKNPIDTPFYVGSGDHPAWSPDGSVVAACYESGGHTLLNAYDVDNGRLLIAPINLPGHLHGFDWGDGALPEKLPENIQAAFLSDPTQITTTQPEGGSEPDPARKDLLFLVDTALPDARLHEEVATDFSALRDKVASEAGWDFLYNLENAFIPFAYTLSPGKTNDWLFTGRAFTFNPASLHAGWVTLIREDEGDLTYWRVFIKARFQDGSQGTPLYQHSWDLNARLSGDPEIYDQGGIEIPTLLPGYWVDFTDLALRFGWQRLPAERHWRSYFPAARFNQFVISGGLNWDRAMLELYPPEILVTPTPNWTPTRTPTRIPTWFRTNTTTPTPIPSDTPTPRPTWTPLAQKP